MKRAGNLGAPDRILGPDRHDETNRPSPGFLRLKGYSKIRWGLMALLPPLPLARNLDVIPFEVPAGAVLAVAVEIKALSK